jgi:CheY-like chemotaxis protein
MPNSKRPRTGKIHCLLVDDQNELLSIVRMILESEGILVTEAHDGVEALSLLESSEKPFDVVVTDIVMPKMSGVELLQAIKASERHLSVPVVLLSGYSQYTREGLQSMGAAELLEKPVDCIQLVEMVKSIAASVYCAAT